MSVKIFISCVSNEFLPYREALRTALTRPDVEVKIQEDFKEPGGDTLEKRNIYIAHCASVLHLVGDMTGDHPTLHDVNHFRDRHPDFNSRLPALSEAIDAGAEISNTQWEAWLALYHHKRLIIVQAAPDAIRAAEHLHILAQTERQEAHLHALAHVHCYPALLFQTVGELVRFAPLSGLLGTATPRGWHARLDRWRLFWRLPERAIGAGMILFVIIMLLRRYFRTP